MSKEDPFDSDLLEYESLLMASPYIRALLSNEPIDLEAMVLRIQASLLHLADICKPGKNTDELRRLVDVFEDIRLSLKKHWIKTI